MKLPKPDTCRPCPMYGDGQGFVPDLIIPSGLVTILLQAPGPDEENGRRVTGWAGKRQPIYESCKHQPVIGATGWDLDRTYLPITGLERAEVSLCNVLKCRWTDPSTNRKTNKLPPAGILKEATARCTEMYLRIPSSTRLIVAQGKEAWAHTQGTKAWGIKDWRGFIGPKTYSGKPVLATIHIADLFRERDLILPSRLDWSKVAKFLAGTWPLPVPEYSVVGETDPHQINELFDLAEQSKFVTLDTEYVKETKLLTMVGIAWRNADGRIAGIQMQWLRGPATPAEKALFIRRLARLIQVVPFVFQNAKADLPVLFNAFDFAYERYFKIEDIMQAHAVLWPEMPHKLGFVSSLYSPFPNLKYLQHVDESLYNWGDCIHPIPIWEALEGELQADPQSMQVYLRQNMDLIPIIMHREREGIRVNQAIVPTKVRLYNEKLNTADSMSQGYAGYPINLMSTGTKGQVAKYLAGCERIRLKSIDKDDISTERNKFLDFDPEDEKHGIGVEYVKGRIQAGAHAILELRAMRAKDAQIMSHYLKPLVVQNDE